MCYISLAFNCLSNHVGKLLAILLSFQDVIDIDLELEGQIIVQGRILVSLARDPHNVVGPLPGPSFFHEIKDPKLTPSTSSPM